MILNVPVFSQNPQGRAIGLSRVQLQPGSGSVNSRKDVSQNIRIGSLQNSSISDDGSAIVTGGKIIRLDTPTPREFNVPDAAHMGFRLSTIDPSGIFLAYGLQDVNVINVNILSATTGEMIASHAFPKKSDFDSLFRLDISENANCIAYTFYNANRNGENDIFITERLERSFSVPILLDSVELIQKPLLISSTGDRVYYHATVLNRVTSAINMSFSVRKIRRNNWEEPRPIIINKNRPVVFMDADSEGRTIAVAAGELGLALFTESGDGWSEPDFLGVTVTTLDRVKLTEDGRVFVSKARPPFSRHAIENNLVEFDLFVYQKDVRNQWTATQLNEAGKHIVGGDFLLSGNGNVLFVRESE